MDKPTPPGPLLLGRLDNPRPPSALLAYSSTPPSYTTGRTRNLQSMMIQNKTTPNPLEPSSSHAGQKNQAILLYTSYYYPNPPPSYTTGQTKQIFPIPSQDGKPTLPSFLQHLPPSALIHCLRVSPKGYALGGADGGAIGRSGVLKSGIPHAMATWSDYRE